LGSAALTPQRGLAGWRRTKLRHAAGCLLVALAPARDLLLRAKHLFAAAYRSHHVTKLSSGKTDRLSESGQQFEYRMTIKSRDRKNAEALSTYLRERPEVIEFRITPTGD
jgi:hypothetical protein